MRKQRRQHAKPAAQADHLDAVLLHRLIGQVRARQPLIRVDVVHDRDVVPAPDERASRALHVDPVPAKIEWRIERRQHAEAQAGHLSIRRPRRRSGSHWPSR